MPDSPLVRSNRSVEVAAAQQALGVLGELAAGRSSDRGMSREVDPGALRDPRLLDCKEVLKAYPPVRVRCQCDKSLDWIALAPLCDHGMQLVHGPKLTAPARRRGGAYDILSGIATSTSQGASAIGTVTWAHDADAGVGHVFPSPDGPYGSVYGLKAHFRCPKCGSEQTLLHSTLLTSWLTAVIEKEREIRLGLPPGVPQASETRAERVSDHHGTAAWSTRAARDKR